MPEQPNHCTSCGKLMPDTNAAYYCSKECMDKVRGVEKNEFKAGQTNKPRGGGSKMSIGDGIVDKDDREYRNEMRDRGLLPKVALPAPATTPTFTDELVAKWRRNSNLCGATVPMATWGGCADELERLLARTGREQPPQGEELGTCDNYSGGGRGTPHKQSVFCRSWKSLRAAAPQPQEQKLRETLDLLLRKWGRLSEGIPIGRAIGYDDCITDLRAALAVPKEPQP